MINKENWLRLRFMFLVLLLGFVVLSIGGYNSLWSNDWVKDGDVISGSSAPTQPDSRLLAEPPGPPPRLPPGPPSILPREMPPAVPPWVLPGPPAPPTFSKIAAGYEHTIVIRTDGTLWAWGENASGQLGDGTYIHRDLPTQIGINTDWISIAAGYAHTLAIKENGTLWAWGNNGTGQLGNGTYVNKNTPIQIGVDTDWLTIAGGQYHSVALKTDGTLWSWGFNSNGQLGDGTYIDKNTPSHIGTDSNWAAIATGGWHTLALKTDGTLWVWGWNLYGQVGDATFVVNRNTPVQIGTETNWSVIAGGSLYTLALKKDNTLWAWGSHPGSIDEPIPNRYTPRQIGTDTNWRSITAGDHHTLALKIDNTLWGWGSNGSGQLGNGTWGGWEKNLIQIGSDSDWSTIAAGGLHSIALKTNETLWTWGENYYGQLGDGTNISKNIPTQIKRVR
ncbi:MAG: hypothetical protein AAB019_04160 [Planctomycetota bacterium]